MKAPARPWTKSELRLLRKRWLAMLNVPITTRTRRIAEELGRNMGSISGQAYYQGLPKGVRGKRAKPKA